MLEELGDSDIPLIIGGLGDFLTEGIYGVYFESYAVVNKELEKFAQNTNHCYFITAAGLTANPDNIHMNAESQRIFGIRYFEGFYKKQHVLKPLTNESKLVEAIYERNLTKEEQKGLIDIQFSMGELSIEAYKTKVSELK